MVDEMTRIDDMKPRRVILLSILIAMVVFSWVTWPLGKDFHEGMPSSHRPEAGGPRYMIAGDHLQFLFHLWMFADATAGKTPLFYHVYEFNQGDDKARYDPGTYYFPLGVFYAVGHFIGGQAVGWNLMLFVSAWLSFLMTWLLARRFCSSPLTAAVAALPGVLLPYFWACCLGGSPTGPGMMWVPMIFYGVDKAIRDRRVWGGVLAGVALFMSPWADLHVFFFVFLAMPAWMGFCLAVALREGTITRQWVSWRDRVVPLLVIGVLMGAAYLQTALARHSLSGTVQEAGRKAGEASIYAPCWQGWFAWDPDNRFNQIYLGIVAAAVLAVGLGLLVRDVWQRRGGRRGRLAIYGLMLATVAGIALLALGPNIPKDHHQAVWKALRHALPPYKMIRQPAKVFCILAPFLSVALALALDRLAAAFTRRAAAVAATIAIGGLLAWDYGRRIEPTICLFDYEQGAYRAIAEDAARCGRENRALSIPIWPGDSHWNSLTEYYATLYRTKMLNGYRPSIRNQYLEEVFERLAPLNIGYVSDAELDALLAKKIGYLVIQEDAFPEKVSPFPVSHTLRELLRHPRIQFLARDEAVWAFKILAPGESKPAGLYGDVPVGSVLGGRSWRARSCVGDPSCVRRGDRRDDEAYVHLANAGDRVRLPPRQLYSVEGLRYLVAARGEGTLLATYELGPSNTIGTVSVPVHGEWSWVELPVPSFEGVGDVVVTLGVTNGAVDVDGVTLVAGSWAWLEPGQSLTLPANAFFRAGYSDVGKGTVHLRAQRTPAAAVFYVPYLPVRPGRYWMTVDYASPVPEGTALGAWTVAPSDGQPLATGPVMAGSPVRLEFRYDGHSPLRIELRFTRNGDLTIRSVTIERME